MSIPRHSDLPIIQDRIRHTGEGGRAIENTPRFFVQLTEMDEAGEPDRERRMVYNRFDLVHPLFVMNYERRKWKRQHEAMLTKLLKFLNESHD